MFAPLFALAACTPPDNGASTFDYLDDHPSDADTDADSDTDTDSDSDTDSDTDTVPTETVTVTFAGTVITVSGTPLGFDDSVRTTPVDGSMSWTAPGTDEDDTPDRGEYHVAGSFTLNVGGRVVRGSGSPEIQVEDLSPDTWRYVDGSQVFAEHPPTMKVDGTADPSLGVWASFTDETGTLLTSDDLPTQFADLDPDALVITFSVDDDGGTLLLELSSMAQP
jgi:hypothetical protein